MCGHMGGKVLVPTAEFVQKLTAARLVRGSMLLLAMSSARTRTRHPLRACMCALPHMHMRTCMHACGRRPRTH